MIIKKGLKKKVKADVDFYADYLDDAASLYAACLSKILFEDEEKIFEQAGSRFPTFVIQEENLITINKIMHLLHKKYKSVRREAVQLVGEFLDYRMEGEFKKTLTIADEEERVFLYEFPEDLKKEIEEIYNSFSKSNEIQIVYTTTWMYSHLDEGDDYIYKENEHPQLEIFSTTPEVLKEFLGKLEKFFEDENMDFSVSKW